MTNTIEYAIEWSKAPSERPKYLRWWPYWRVKNCKAFRVRRAFTIAPPYTFVHYALIIITIAASSAFLGVFIENKLPVEYSRASSSFRSFMTDVKDKLDLRDIKVTEKVVESLFRDFRCKLETNEAIKFANALPVMLRALFVGDWKVGSPPTRSCDTTTEYLHDLEYIRFRDVGEVKRQVASVLTMRLFDRQGLEDKDRKELCEFVCNSNAAQEFFGEWPFATPARCKPCVGPSP